MTMKNKKPQVHHMWTKEEVKKLYLLWSEKSCAELSEEIGVDKSQLRTMAARMRREGFKLASKRKNGYVGKMLKDLKAELKLK